LSSSTGGGRIDRDADDAAGITMTDKEQSVFEQKDVSAVLMTMPLVVVAVTTPKSGKVIVISSRLLTRWDMR
jgi:hypothetical protein